MTEERASAFKKPQDHQASVNSRMRPPQLFLGLEWILATMFSSAIGTALTAFTVAFWHYKVVIGWTITGVLVGSAQWLVLRQKKRIGMGWILASIVGYAVGGSILDVSLKATSGIVGGTLSGASLGIALGLAQWIILRLRVSGAGWWILSNAIGWGVGWAAGQIAYQQLGIVGGLTIPGAISGAITGASLLELLRRS